MEIILIFLGFTAVLGILHTYIIYPWWVVNRARKNEELAGGKELYYRLSDKKEEAVQVSTPYPLVSVLMAVHNEESVIASKLDSLLAQNYPGPYQVLIGSDNSTDRTNEILRVYAARDKCLQVTEFGCRQGKPGIINQLATKAGPLTKNHVFLLTDASVILAPEVVSELVNPMRYYPNLAIADARMLHTGMQEAGIGETENLYIGREVKIKQAEGKLWGYMMGPFGGCYALRSNYFRPVPDNYLVDDFYLCLSAYAQGGRGISVADAVCHEAVGQQLGDEFRRKVRISSGNWQNAVTFLKQWWPPVGKLNFAFFSHKILRWLTPFFLLFLLLDLGVLYACFGNYWAGGLFLGITAGLIIIPALDFILDKVLQQHWFLLRSIRYFLAMNLALLVGFFRYLKGIQSNVWQPSKRH